MWGKGRKLMRVVSALLGKEKRGPSVQGGGEETEVAGLSRANVRAGAGKSPGRRGRTPAPRGHHREPGSIVWRAAWQCPS